MASIASYMPCLPMQSAPLHAQESDTPLMDAGVDLDSEKWCMMALHNPACIDVLGS